jgi:Na+/H+ antiporter NhaD/arsenite permease-like protein
MVHVFASTGSVSEVALWMATPFALLLALIAVMPLTPPRLKHVWEHWYPHIAIGLGLLVAVFYIVRMEGGTHAVLDALHEYASFIILIGSLFVVAGGIHISIRGELRPIGNVLFLFFGASLANLIGTTGASMVLIRPFLRANAHRVAPYHVVFFIFLVSNIGGALTPIGDPPLFLGYLHGVPFFWLVEKAFLPWAVTLGSLLAIFWMLDQRNFRAAPAKVREEDTTDEPFVRVRGLQNVLFLFGIVAAVFLPGTWFIRETVMLVLTVAAYRLSNPELRKANEFTFGPIREVAFLFLGIFLTMLPALGYLGQNGRQFGFDKPFEYYVAAGSLSAVLDNAPTYLNFLTLEEASVPPESVRVHADGTLATELETLPWLLNNAPAFIIAVSLGAVFFGAMTYIGNGPNFMVKSIAESSGVRVPSFFGYILRYSLPLLLPVLLAVGWIFLG